METEYHYTRSIWLDNDLTVVKEIDQKLLQALLMIPII